MIINTKQLHGAIREARDLGEILLDEPTLRNFSAYRRALVNLATVLGTTELELARAVIVEDNLRGYTDGGLK